MSAPEKMAEDYRRAALVLARLHAALADGGVSRESAAGLLNVLHRTIGETDDWSRAAMVSASGEAERLLAGAAA